ncbi:PREDICTED: tetraketide alpha-pyrone reductase 1 isoform X2 [Brassica oleracea var. oleracea]|uniref:tetraketide alpha-pyrone reductase 1 isoform X2 n=1 Tax=Brassica oleracea var. oleracea TaxID=109376 RepID=UPI0006A6AFF8|nr:PREDICTED: tetraketide alpha-pyrone reductase 1 isoform X2 [Brassica oleracea var. oleracea]
MDQPKGKVCVTGASGFLASWLVKRLLLAASSPLHKSLCIHFIDILLTLISCDMIGGDFETSYESLKGVVLTSSSSTVRIRDDFDPNIPLDESVWTSVELCKRFQTLAEQAAWKFCEENSIDLVTVLPSFLVGPSLPPDLCSTASDVLGLLKGETEKFQWHGQMGYVHIDDVARTHILVFEHEAAGGRYICSSNVVSLEELVSFLSTRYPSLHIPERFEKLNRLHYDFDTSKIKSLGLKFKSLEEMFDDCIASFVEKGYLSHVVTSQ